MKVVALILFCAFSAFAQAPIPGGISLPGNGGTPIFLTNGEGPYSISRPWSPDLTAGTNFWLDAPDFSYANRIGIHWHNPDTNKVLQIQWSESLTDPFTNILCTLTNSADVASGQYFFYNPVVFGGGSFSFTAFSLTDSFTKAHPMVFFRAVQFPKTHAASAPFPVILFCGLHFCYLVWKTLSI